MVPFVWHRVEACSEMNYSELPMQQRGDVVIKSSGDTPQYTTVGVARHAHTEQLLRAVKK